MRLSFLGNSYEPATPATETTKTEHSGLFMGKRFTLEQHTARARQQSAALKYRGVDYTG